MNTRPAQEYTIFAPSQLLRNWREQGLAARVSVHSSVTGMLEGLLHKGRPAYFIFVYRSTVTGGFNFK